MKHPGSVWAVLAASLAVLMAAPAGAHHSAAQFDFSTPVTLTGKVKRIRMANPHMRLVLEITDDKRGTRDVEFEGHSLNNFYRSGWRPDMIKVGDRIELRVAPRRDGEDGGYVTGVKTADGQEFGTGTTQRDAESGR